MTPAASKSTAPREPLGGAAPSTSRVGPFLAALVPFLLLAWRFDFLVDDAFISWRYAQHLAAGQGLVFNLGEAQPVEGYTNLLWVLALALVQRVGLDPAVASRVLSVACGVLLMWLFSGAVARNATTRATSSSSAVLASVFLATLPPLAVWATGGLETMAFALCVFATHERLGAGPGGTPRPVQAGTWAVLATLLRADGFVWIAVVLGAALIARRREPGFTRALRTTALMFAAAAGGFVLWRWFEYGTLAPNTARSKVHLGTLSLERGGLYVLSLLLSVPSIALACASALRAGRGPHATALREAGLVVLGGCAYVVLVGGDWMMMYRMLVPVMPFVALLAWCGLEALPRPGARLALGGVCIGLSLLPSFNRHPVPRSVRELAHFRWSHAELMSEYEVWHKGVVDIEQWMLLGRALALHTQPGESYVLGNIGAIPFYSGLTAYDTHGLTNREPFAPADPERRASAGHDRTIEVSAFEHFQPTYLGLQLAPADDPYRHLPANWLDPEHPRSASIEIEIIPLDPARGFPPGTVLQLVRNVW